MGGQKEIGAEGAQESLVILSFETQLSLDLFLKSPFLVLSLSSSLFFFFMLHSTGSLDAIINHHNKSVAVMKNNAFPVLSREPTTLPAAVDTEK